ncbi:MAG: lysozyme inhibitor LprI family protein [Acidimicrobiales bacterium]
MHRPNLSVAITTGLLTCASLTIPCHTPFASGATTPTSVRTASSTLMLPILGEKFSVLSCNKNTTIGLEGCAEHRIIALDKRINALRHYVFHILNHQAGRDFILAENDWFTYRQAMCTSESDVNAGGSLEPVDFAQCLVRLDAQHVSELTSMKSSYESGG